MHDLREEADANYYFGELKMWNDSNNRKFEVGVVVEAKSDEDLFGAHFRQDCIFFCFGGWEKVAKTIQLVNQYNIQGIVGIIDADFRRVLGIDITEENLFLTDFHDSEMMLIESFVWEKILHHCADTRKTAKGTGGKLLTFKAKHQKSIKEFILEVLKPLSILRLLNEKEELGLKFRTQKKNDYDYVKYFKFISKDDLNFIGLEQLIKTVEDKSQKQGFFKNRPDLRSKLEELLTEDFDLKELTNGHDVLNVLSLALEKVIASKKVKADELSKMLIVAYRFEDFQKTNLYLALKKWEENNSPPYQLFKKQEV